MSENPYTAPGHVDGTFKRRSTLRVWITVLTVIGIVILLAFFLLPIHRTSRETPRRITCINNLRQIALALRSYESAHGALPPAYTVDADGKPLHSWRTLILPFLDQKQLYDTIDLTKPWDDPANAKAFNTEILVYRCPSAVPPAHETTYLAIVAENGCFRPAEPRHLSEITDPPSQTLMVIEAPPDQSVHWMSPKDADEEMVTGFGPNSKLAHPSGMNAAFADGSVRFLDSRLPVAQRRAMISIAGHDKVE